MVKFFLQVWSGVALAFTSIMWGVVFWLILRLGSVRLIEPSRPVLLIEFAVAILFALWGMATLIYGVIKRRRL